MENKSLIFGAGYYGKVLNHYYNKNNEQIVGFLDNNEKLDDVDGVKVYSPSQIKDLEFNQIIISILDTKCILDVKEQLEKLGISEDSISVLKEDKELFSAICSSYIKYAETDARVEWLKGYSKKVYESGIKGMVAECGVNMGDFSYYINKYFPDRKLYLFDTFNGFDMKDIEIERQLKDDKFMSGEFNNSNAFHLNVDNVSLENIVMKKMPYSDLCIVKKGYFPNTAQDVNGKFCFVNLDMDLFQPMYEGLKFFWEKMNKGGVILLHDYFYSELPGVNRAVDLFEREIDEKLNMFSIGDGCSIAIMK